MFNEYILLKITETGKCVPSFLTLLTLWNEAYTFASSAEPDYTARNKPSHLILHCLLFVIGFMNDIPICNNGYTQKQR